jgi:hypothetical protein
MVRVSRKFFTVALTIALTVTLFASPMAALAAHPADGNPEIENLKQRIEALEAEKKTAKPLSISSLAEKITLSGLIELEAAYNKPEGGEESSDLTLATVELGLEVQATDYLGGHIVLLWEEGEDMEAYDILDEAVIILTKPQPVWGVTPSFTGGKMYLPFGKFNSYMITDPLTLDLGETNQSAGMLTLEGELWTLQAGTFSGETDTSGDHDTIDSWVAALEARPFETLSFGISLISDLAESDLELVADDEEGEDLYSSSVMGASAWLSWQFGQFGFEAEYLTALDKFDRELLGLTDLTGRRPSAWNLELAWMPNDRWQVAGRFEQADDFQDDVTRYGGTVSYGLFEHAVLALEYLHGDAKGPDADPDHTVTAQLAFEF